MLAVLVFVPLYPKIPLVSVSGTFVSIRLEDLLIGLALILWLFYLIFTKKIKDFLGDRLNQSILLFFFIGAVSLFSAIFVTSTVTTHLGILHWLRRVELIHLLPLMMTVIKTKKQINICLFTLFMVVLLVSIYALGQQFLNLPVISTVNSELSKGQILDLTPGARVNSTFAGHYDLAIFLSMAIVMIAALFSILKGKLRVWSILLGVLAFVVLIMTAARLAFVAVVIGTLASLTLVGQKKIILFAILIAILALLYPSQLRDRFISTIIINIQQGGERFSAQTKHQAERSLLNIPTLPAGHASPSAKEASASATETAKLAPDIAPGEPIDSTELGVYRSMAIRLDVEWPRAIRAFTKNPVLGTGYSSIGLATDNDLLRSLGEVGLLGTAAFALILIEIIKRATLIYKNGDKFLKFLSAGTLALIITFLINGLFIDVFEASKIAALFWAFTGISLAGGTVHPRGGGQAEQRVLHPGGGPGHLEGRRDG